MTKYLVVLAWQSVNVASSEHDGKIALLPFNEKISNVAVVQAFNEKEAKQKVLKMWGLNKNVEKNLKVFDIDDLSDSWSYFRRGGKDV